MTMVVDLFPRCKYLWLEMILLDLRGDRRTGEGARTERIGKSILTTEEAERVGERGTDRRGEKGHLIDR